MIATILIVISSEFSPFSSRYRRIRNTKKLKGPMGLPIIGNLFQISSESTHLQLTEFSQKYGNIYKLKVSCILYII